MHYQRTAIQWKKQIKSYSFILLAILAMGMGVSQPASAAWWGGTCPANTRYIPAHYSQSGDVYFGPRCQAWSHGGPGHCPAGTKYIPHHYSPSGKVYFRSRCQAMPG